MGGVRVIRLEIVARKTRVFEIVERMGTELRPVLGVINLDGPSGADARHPQLAQTVRPLVHSTAHRVGDVGLLTARLELRSLHPGLANQLRLALERRLALHSIPAEGQKNKTQDPGSTHENQEVVQVHLRFSWGFNSSFEL